MSELDFIDEWDATGYMVAGRPTVRLKVVDKFVLWRKFRKAYVKDHARRLQEAVAIQGVSRENPSVFGESLAKTSTETV